MPARRLICGLSQAAVAGWAATNPHFPEQNVTIEAPVQRLAEHRRGLGAGPCGAAATRCTSASGAAPIPASVPAPDGSTRQILVYGAPVGRDDGRMTFTGERLDMVERPPPPENVRDDYAVHHCGESRVPSFSPGARRGGPHISARPRGGVAPLHAGTARRPTFHRRAGARLGLHPVMRQHNPPAEIEYSAADVKSVHVVVFASRH